MTLTHTLTAAALRTDVSVPVLDFEWLRSTPQGQAAEASLQSTVGMVIFVALIVAGVVFIVGIACWVASRAGAGKHQSLFGGIAMTALVAAIVLGGIVGAAQWGADDVFNGWFPGGSVSVDNPGQ